MKEVNIIQRNILCAMAKKVHGIEDPDKCPAEWLRVAKMASEVKAYQRAVILHPFYEYSISSFTGKDANTGEDIIPLSVAKKAKKNIVEYCWRGVTIQQVADMTETELDAKSSMTLRRKRGDNVIIYSNDKPGDSARGKTLCAAIIMKEAIKRRLDPWHVCDTYEWVDYGNLIEELKHDTARASALRTSDWLVVDDISNDTYTSLNGQVFISSLLNPFFTDRVRDRLPTILVFRFDLSTSEETRKKFGVSLNKIIKGNNITKINLS